MHNEPLVSIIMPSYNSSLLIGYSIESVLNQTYQNWELIIVDDCSKDNSRQVIQQYVDKDSRITFITLFENKGAAGARNVALDRAKGEYVAFLDSDDLWESMKLTKQIAFMEENNYHFTFSDYYIIKENGELTGKSIIVPKQITYHQYLKNTIIGCLTVIIHRDKVGDFKMPLIKSSQDMALWLVILKRGYVAYGFNECLAGYRLVENSNSSKKWKAAKDVWRVYRDFEKLSLIYSSICFVGYAFNAIKKRL